MGCVGTILYRLERIAEYLSDFFLRASQRLTIPSLASQARAFISSESSQGNCKEELRYLFLFLSSISFRWYVGRPNSMRSDLFLYFFYTRLLPLGTCLEYRSKIHLPFIDRHQAKALPYFFKKYFGLKVYTSTDKICAK